MSRKKILWIEVGVVLFLALGPHVGSLVASLASPYPDSGFARYFAYFDPRSVGSAAYDFAVVAFVLYTLWASDGASLDFGIRMRPDGWILVGVAGLVVLAVFGIHSSPPPDDFVTRYVHDLMQGHSVYAALNVVGQSLVLVTVIGYVTTRFSELLSARSLTFVGIGLCVIPLTGFTATGMVAVPVLGVLFGWFFLNTRRLGMPFALSVILGLYGLASVISHLVLNNG